MMSELAGRLGFGAALPRRAWRGAVLAGAGLRSRHTALCPDTKATAPEDEREMSNGDLNRIANYIRGIAEDVLRGLYARQVSRPDLADDRAASARCGS